MAISGSATTNRTSALEPRHVGSPQSPAYIGVALPLALIGAPTGRIWRWGADVSAPQQIGVREPTGRLSGVGGADVSAPQQIAVGEPTGRFPSKLALPLGSRPVHD